MKTLSYYPDGFDRWLFDGLGMAPGDEVAPATLDALSALNQGWVKGRGKGLEGYTEDPVLMRAYACFYMTVNMPKLWFVLDRCRPDSEPALTGRPLRVTELGCGPGTFLWALLFYLRQRPTAGTFTGTGVDAAALPLDIARSLAERLPAALAANLEWVRDDWRRHVADAADILILGNVLAECPTHSGAWIDEIQAPLVLVIEPGTCAGFGAVRRLRDRFVARGWGIAFPCTGLGPCPMAADDWCHFHINRFVRPFIQRIAGRLRRLNPRHHFTAFVFTRPPTPAPDHWRVMSRLRKAHRSAIRYLCNGEHIIETVLNRRERTPDNRAFREADMGDCLRITAAAGRASLVRRRRLCRRDTVAEAGSQRGDQGGARGDDAK